MKKYLCVTSLIIFNLCFAWGFLGRNEAYAYTVVPNPPLSQPCNVALIIDSSGSIGNNMRTYQNAFITFAEALSGKNTQFSVTDFDISGRVLQAFTSNIDTVKAAILQTKSGGSTNWEDGLVKGRSTFTGRSDRPNLVIFASDGGANASNESSAPSGSGGARSPGAFSTTAVERAVAIANDLKSNYKARILAIGITDNGGPGVDTLQAISGPNVDTGDITTSDVITTDFAGLAAKLGALATEECSIPITEKDAPPTPIPSLIRECHKSFMGWWDWCAVVPTARYVLTILLGLFGSVAVLMIIWGGILYITSRGDEEKIKKAKKIILFTLIGILIVTATWGLISLTASLIGVV